MTKNKDGFASGVRVSNNALFAHLAKKRQEGSVDMPEPVVSDSQKKPPRKKKAD